MLNIMVESSSSNDFHKDLIILTLDLAPDEVGLKGVTLGGTKHRIWQRIGNDYSYGNKKC